MNGQKQQENTEKTDKLHKLFVSHKSREKPGFNIDNIHITRYN